MFRAPTTSGDEKNPQLQRIYGTAFKNKTEMEAHFNLLEEAKRRDHRKLGKELRLFHIDDEVGQGLILWTPNRRDHSARNCRTSSAAN